MPTYTFIPEAGSFDETQALYISLFNAPQSSGSAGMGYWENLMSSNPAQAINGFSGYAYYNGQVLNSSNIGSEINGIYDNLFGAPASSSGNAYWASQWTGDGGTMSIGQIADAIYKNVENIPTTSSNFAVYTQVMDNKIMTYFDEAQSFYLTMFNRAADTAGLVFWENKLASDTTWALNAISPFVTYNGQALSPSNIGSEINSIYDNLFGAPANSSGNAYWASQWTGDGGTMSIGQIADVIYKYVEYSDSSPSNPHYNSYQALNNTIQANNYFTMFNGTMTNIADSAVNPSVYTLSTSDAGHAFASSSSQPDTLVIPFGYSGSSLGVAGNGGYFTFQGDASGLNTGEINYAPYNPSNLTYYLENASNFQILDFNYSQGPYYLNQSTFDLSTINSGFNTFILDDTYNPTNNYASTTDSSYGFTNATDNDTFVVKATTSELDISNGGNGNTTSVIMDGGAGGVGLGTLFFSPASSGAAATINIYSNGSAQNAIQLMGNMFETGNNLTGSFTLNIYGSDALSIGLSSSPAYSPISTNDNGIELRDGSTLTIAGHSSSSNLTAYIYENSPTISQGVTVNAAGFAGTLSLIETQWSNLSPDTFILGSGTDSVATNDVNASVTVGTGTDTIVSNAAYSTDSSYTPGESSLNATPGYITTIHGSIIPGDQITFGTPLGGMSSGPADWQIYPGLSYGGNPSEGTGVIITSLTQFQESGAANAAAAIINVISTLEAPWDATSPNPVSAAGLLDYAGWFQYGGNTYVVNSDQGQNQVIELVGTYSLSNASIVTSAGTATITNITH